MKQHLLLLGLLMLTLSGCSHKTLIAPCDGNVAPTKLDGNVGKIGSVVAPLGPDLNVTPTAAPPTDCGPLKPVNE